MALAVHGIDRALPPLHPAARLAILVASGALIYGAWLLAFARDAIGELAAVVRRRPLPA